jgi:hypothetical protein
MLCISKFKIVFQVQSYTKIVAGYNENVYICKVNEQLEIL